MTRERPLLLCSLIVFLLMFVGLAPAAMAAPLQVSPSDPGRDDGAPAGPVALMAGAPLASPETATDIKNLDTDLTYATIADALAAAATLDGHVLDVQVASHAEGICTVSKAVTIRGGGGGGAIITSTTDTQGPGTGNGQAWFAVTVAGVRFEDLTLDGNNNLIRQAIRFNEAGTVARCTIQHIKRPPAEYYGIGIGAMKNVEVTDCAVLGLRPRRRPAVRHGRDRGRGERLHLHRQGPGRLARLWHRVGRRRCGHALEQHHHRVHGC